MKASIQVVGPAEAEMLLQDNLGNRHISQRVVDRYAEDMREGRWRPNGSSISIYDDGETIRLLNGQHRLLALIAADVTITFVIVEEDTPEVFSTLDQGYNRTTGQILALAGYSNTNVTQAMARYAINYEKHAGSTEPWKRMAVNTSQVLAWLAKQEPTKVHAVVSDFIQMRTYNPTTNTWYAGLSWLVREKSPSASTHWLRFHDAYVTGVSLHAGSPVLALRQYTVNRSRAGGRYQQSAWDRQSHLAVGIRAWNDFLDGREARVYRFQKNMLPMPDVH